MTAPEDLTPVSDLLETRPSELLAGLSGVLELVGHMNGSEGLDETLLAVAQGIVAAAGFEAVVINYMRSDGLLEVTTVVGPPELREALLGKEVEPGDLIREMEAGEKWGRLRFNPHGSLSVADYHWVPDIPVPSEPDGWHPDDALLAPLYADGDQLIGIVSVDLPKNGRLPDASQQQLLGLLATQAEIAINNARLLQQLRANEESLRMAFDVATVGLALISFDHRSPLRILHGNTALSALADVLGRSPLETLSDLLDPDDPECDPSVWLASLTASGPIRIEKRVSRGSGDEQELWLEVTTSTLPRHSTQSPQAMVQIEDVTLRRQADLEVRRKAARDPLTGLGNRNELLSRLAQLCLASRESSTSGAVLFCDLNGFKEINDTFGHAAGDTVLAACAGRLASLVRGSDEAYRVGGDEFVILLADVTSWDIEHIVERIKSSIAAPLSHDGEFLHLSVSVGWAKVDGRITDVGRILAAADAAMYADKRANRPAPRTWDYRPTRR